MRISRDGTVVSIVSETSSKFVTVESETQAIELRDMLVDVSTDAQMEALYPEEEHSLEDMAYAIYDQLSPEEMTYEQFKAGTPIRVTPHAILEMLKRGEL